METQQGRCRSLRGQPKPRRELGRGRSSVNPQQPHVSRNLLPALKCLLIKLAYRHESWIYGPKSFDCFCVGGFPTLYTANRMQERVTPEAMRLRRCTVEHPLATIKYRIFGHPRLLTRGLTGARAEIGIATMAYNLAHHECSPCRNAHHRGPRELRRRLRIGQHRSKVLAMRGKRGH